MSQLKQYNLNGEETGSVAIDEKITGASVNSQVVKNYITAIRKNARQWSANTKTRAEVKHTTKKTFRQKGTGRARQGMVVAPQFRGGGIVFGPKPKFNQHVRINKKERQSAIRAILAEKVRNNQLHVLESTEMEKPQTKTLSAFLKKTGLGPRVLFLGEGNYLKVEAEGGAVEVSIKCSKHQNFAKSLRNIPKTAFGMAKNTNIYDLMVAQDVVITSAALEEIQNWLA